MVRPSYTYGPTWIPSGFGGQDYTVVDRMRRGLPIVCHGDGTSLWVMTAASDFAVGLVGLLGPEGRVGEAFHITSDEVLTWDAIYRTIAQAAGAELKMVHVPSELIASLYPERGGSLLGDKAWSVVFDNRKIRRFVPGYRPRVTFAEGMARSIAWLDADPAHRVVSEEADRRIDRVIAAQGRAAAGGVEEKVVETEMVRLKPDATSGFETASGYGAAAVCGICTVPERQPPSAMASRGDVTSPATEPVA